MTDRGGNLLPSTYWLCMYQHILAHSCCEGWLLIPLCMAFCPPGLSGPLSHGVFLMHPILFCGVVPSQLPDSALAVVEL